MVLNHIDLGGVDGKNPSGFSNQKYTSGDLQRHGKENESNQPYLQHENFNTPEKVGEDAAPAAPEEGTKRFDKIKILEKETQSIEEEEQQQQLLSKKATEGEAEKEEPQPEEIAQTQVNERRENITAAGVPNGKEENENEGVGQKGGVEYEGILIPGNFLVAANDNLKTAKENYMKTLKWRKENCIDDILCVPQTKFHVLKALIPWFFHGYDKNGNFVVIQKVGEFNPQRLYENNLSRNDALEYAMFYQEYMWSILSPYCNTEKVTMIMDLKGLSVYNINSEVLSYIKDALSLQSKHWPAKTEKSFIINTPSWFTSIYNLIFPWLNERQRAKLKIVSEEETLQSLREHIPLDQIPAEYGGESVNKIGECVLEKNMFRYVEAVAVQHGATFVELKQRENEDEKNETGDAFTATIDSISSTMASWFTSTS